VPACSARVAYYPRVDFDDGIKSVDPLTRLDKVLARTLAIIGSPMVIMSFFGMFGS
jgi:hypothetical protein